MTEISDRYRRLASEFATCIDAVGDDRWSAPSPCEGWSTRDVVGHVVGTQAMFLGLVGREMPADAVRVIAGVAAFGDAIRSPQACGPEIPVPEDADLTTRMLALVGRVA